MWFSHCSTGKHLALVTYSESNTMKVYILEAGHKTVPGRCVQVFGRRADAEEAAKQLRAEFPRQLAYVRVDKYEVHQ